MNSHLSTKTPALADPGLAKGHVTCRRRLRAEAGSGLVEYAFVLIVFLTLVFGIIDFSRALYVYHHLSNVARDATRWAAVNGQTCGSDTSCNGVNGMNTGPASQADIQTYVKNHTPSGIDTTQLATTVTWSQGNGPEICSSNIAGVGGPFPNYPGCTVEVQISYPFTFVTPLVSNKTLTLSSASEMVIAH
jgi:Flp pilus assembly protein TadG